LERIIETTGKLKTTKKRQKLLSACADIIEELFKTEIYGVFINSDYDNDKKPHSVNFVFKKER